VANFKWIKFANCEAPMVTNNVWLLIMKIYKQILNYQNMVKPKWCLPLSILIFFIISAMLSMNPNHVPSNSKFHANVSWTSYENLKEFMWLHNDFFYYIGGCLWIFFARYYLLAIVNGFLVANFFSYITLWLISLS
jgi:hypothetical protein